MVFQLQMRLSCSSSVTEWPHSSVDSGMESVFAADSTSTGCRWRRERTVSKGEGNTGDAADAARESEPCEECTIWSGLEKMPSCLWWSCVYA